MNNLFRYVRAVVGTLMLPVLLVGCGGSGGGGSSTSSTSPANGTFQAAITDAPSSNFDHVWITVRGIWFHTSSSAGPQQAGWIKYSLPAAVTVDLTTLTNGQLSNVFQNISLPAGDYQQIRLMLAPTEGSLTASAGSDGLSYNNQVDYTDSLGTVQHVPLRIPSPREGIKLAGNFQIAPGGTLDIAIDFDIGHQIVEYALGHGVEYMLKPVLTYFNLDNAGAITGQIDPGIFRSSTNPSGGYNFVIKAEQLSANGTYHTVVRATTVDSNGNFILYPLPVANGTTKDYDIVLRGRNVDTYIIKDVPVTGGTTPTSNPTLVQSTPITMTLDSEYTANFTGAVNPTGAWATFYQTIPGDTASYNIRYRHLDPFTGMFYNAIPLSTGPLYWGTYHGGHAVSFASVMPVEGTATFDVVANSLFYTRTLDGTVTGTANALAQLSPVTLTIPPPAAPDSISGTITETGNASNAGLNTAYLVVARDGFVVTTQSESASLGSSFTFTLSNLPGGSSSATVPGAYYTLYLVAWNSANPPSTLTITRSTVVDLTQGSMTGVSLTLQ